MSYKSNIRSDSVKIPSKEMTQVLSDLKVMVHNLSEIVARLEKVSRNYETVSSGLEVNSHNIEEEKTKKASSITKRINTFQYRNRTTDNKRKTSLSKVGDTPTHGKKKVAPVEAVNQTVINSKTLDESSTAPHVKYIKKKFEFSTVRVQEDREADMVKTIEDNTKNTEINVNVQSLKQKFESEKSMPTENLHLKISEEKRRKSEEKGKFEKIDTSEISDERVKRMLKYFQPLSP